ncbi:DUF389 domain-containing protein [Sphingobacterium phlebotomi]|uniref:DUF389 domain-containing protein n=1 Tax=Sphingobacterium phlebotomi TaxID=2605433 RepID=A0A5D4H9F0_9SPHI|nr:DUF389 domain-containing protein [Sphingobacterium phlebotomi]
MSYDVLIAFFGGLVGVIAITRVDKGNPIPGVAIATALMPPLCTAGYGLATGKLAYFAGALYLYIINCVFICLATFVIVKYLRYPKMHYVDKQKEKRISQSITIITLILVLPSLYFAYRLLQERKYTYKVHDFIQQELTEKGYTVIYEKLLQNTSPKRLELAFLTKTFSSREIATLERAMKTFGIENTDLVIRQDSLDLKSTILNEINQRTTSVNEKDLTIRALNNRLAKYNVIDDKLGSNMAILFPEVDNYSLGIQNRYVTTDSLTEYIAFIYSANEMLTEEQDNKLQQWMKSQFPQDSLEFIRKTSGEERP